MLKKLFVHEWKDTWRLVGILNVAVLIMTFIAVIAVKTDGFDKLMGNAYTFIIGVLYMMVYIGSIVALSFVCSFYFFARFYTQFYTDQGYLMHTLPVSPHALIWSKAFVTMIWQVISGLVGFFSIISLICAASGENLFEDFNFNFDALRTVDGALFFVIVNILLFILMMVGGMLLSVFLGYAAVSIGQSFKKQKVLGSILIYMVLYFMVQTVSSFVVNPFVLGFNFGGVNYSEQTIMAIFTGIMGVGAVVIIGAAVAFYFITYTAMKNRLNLE